ncbi:hypothetical protein PUN28_005159 [Cardiocondyla obscurior]|uniref:Transmembrane protein n=1 Tax=Cardiocondyla obscurior TaxID=286306 RepID=A0AAW2GHB0_9HYME
MQRHMRHFCKRYVARSPRTWFMRLEYTRCETSHVLHYALIYHSPFHSLSLLHRPFSLSVSLSIFSFFFFFFFFYFSLCISLSFRHCKGAGVVAVYEYSRSPRAMK